jgi:DNA-binding FadR family transcriptional regulator
MRQMLAARSIRHALDLRRALARGRRRVRRSPRACIFAHSNQCCDWSTNRSGTWAGLLDGGKLDDGAAPRHNAQGALTQLRAWLSQRPRSPGERLPPERQLCEALGVSRSELRKALAQLEAAGEVWRHVGKGTFIGAAPGGDSADLAATAARTSPAEVMNARLLLEPTLAAEAALHATHEDLAELRACLDGARMAESWRHYETWDNRLHRAIAASAGNLVMLALFDSLNTIRRAVTWGRLRPDDMRPPEDHHSFADHDRIFAAIAGRDPAAAAETMRSHLEAVRANLLRRTGA